jgi:hypothetical protein
MKGRYPNKPAAEEGEKVDRASRTSFSSKITKADVVHDRLLRWKDEKKSLWEAALARDGKQKNCNEKKDAGRDVRQGRRAALEKRVCSAIKMGDVRKALQMFTAAPIAPKSDETLQALQNLHPLRDLSKPSAAILAEKLVRAIDTPPKQVHCPSQCGDKMERFRSGALLQNERAVPK